MVITLILSLQLNPLNRLSFKALATELLQITFTSTLETITAGPETHT